MVHWRNICIIWISKLDLGETSPDDWLWQAQIVEVRIYTDMI
jgi:hypothetical protein